MSAFVDLHGKQFGRWKVLDLASKGPTKWNVQCDCGTKGKVKTGDLQSGKSRSCGCLHLEVVRRPADLPVHKGTPEYRAWCMIKTRCYNAKFKSYPLYGGRGIKVSQRWLDSFAAFLTDMGPRPEGSYTIERINNDGHYEPGNCRWITIQEQQYNKRNNHLVRYNGRTMSLALAVKFATVVLPQTAYNRVMRGWDFDRAMNTPFGMRAY